MTKQKVVSNIRLKNLIIEKKLSQKEVADFTHSSVRSVQRWLVTGIPEIKWEILQIKTK